MTTALAIAGTLKFNPLKDKLVNENGKEVMLEEPHGIELPPNGFGVEDAGYQPPAEDGSNLGVVVADDSDRLQILPPFNGWDGGNIIGMRLLLKAYGKCTTDYISQPYPLQAGSFIAYFMQKKYILHKICKISITY